MCLCTFVVKGRWFSQRPKHPLTYRRKTGGTAEPFSKRIWKFFGAARFVRLFLSYGQIGPNRKNMAIMQDLTVTLEKIAKMQDWIVINVTDILSATLRTICPSAFGLRHFAADQNQNVKMSFWFGDGQNVRHQQKGGQRHISPHLPGRSRLQNANLVPGTTWRTFFPRRCQNQKCKMHFWFSKAYFAPLNRHSNVECKMHPTSCEFERQADARSCVLLVSPLP